MTFADKTIATTTLFACFILLMTNSLFAHDPKFEAMMKGVEEMPASKAQELLDSADAMFKKRLYVESRDVYQAALVEAEKFGGQSDKTEALSMIARTYLITDDKESGRKWIARAKEIASENYQMGYSRYLGVWGRFIWKDDKNKEATEIFKQMYVFCSERKLHDRAIDAAHMIGITGTVDEQIEWGLKGIKEAEAGQVTSWLGPLWNNLGWTYEHNGRPEESLDAYINARKHHYKYGTTRNKVIADWAVGHAFRLVGDWTNAAKEMRPLLNSFEEMKDDEFVGLTCLELGEIELNSKNKAEAHKHFVRAEKLLKEAGMDEWDAETYKKLAARVEETK